MPDEEIDKTQQQVVRVRNMISSQIHNSHKMHVNDIQFVPPNFNVDRRNPSDGKTTHFLSCSEDGSVNIWDTRSATQQVLQKTPEATWNPYLQINLFRSDGSGEMGLTRLLFDPKQQMPTFLAASDEGDLVLVDWSIKPP